MSRVRAFGRRGPLALCLVLDLSGCYPMGNSDGISPEAGFALRENRRLMTINPYAGDGSGPNPGGSGARAAQVMERYRADRPQGSETAGAGAEGASASAPAVE